MTYELAKELKDAGFPQPSPQDLDLLPGSAFPTASPYVGTEIRYFKNCDEYESSWIFRPTLSELIAACGDVILYKLPVNGKWIADETSTYLCTDGWFVDNQILHQGDTPEEAVAHLWLALNKK